MVAGINLVSKSITTAIATDVQNPPCSLVCSTALTCCVCLFLLACTEKAGGVIVEAACVVELPFLKVGPFACPMLDGGHHCACACCVCEP